MPLPAEVETWKAEMLKAGVTEDELKPFLARAEANEAVANALKGSVMATADYTRQMQALKAVEKQAKEKIAESDAYIKDLAQWKNKEDANYKAWARAKADAESKLAEVQARIKTLKDNGYLGDDDVKGILTEGTPSPAPVNQPKKTEGEDDRYLSIEEFNKQ